MYGNDEYLEAQVLTASPKQLHLMVIDGDIRFAVQAKRALEKNDIETAHFALNSSREFVSELMGGLNEEQSPEIVSQLKSVFFFVFRRLVDADLQRDVSIVSDTLKILRMYHETWYQLVENVKENPEPNRHFIEHVECAVPMPKETAQTSPEAPRKSWTT